MDAATFSGRRKPASFARTTARPPAWRRGAWPGVVATALAPALIAGVARGPQPTAGVEGLWKYETIRSSGGVEVPIDGLFLFKDGRFVQQSLNRGEPFDQQLAQAHAGAYAIDGETLELHVEVGLVVDPRAPESRVDDRTGSRHRVRIARRDRRLTLTFGSGTVQTFTRAGDGVGELVALGAGAFALVDGHFLLVWGTPDDAVAGSGRFERRGGSELSLIAERWFTVRQSRPAYGSAGTIAASFAAERLELPDGHVIAASR